MLTIFTPTYNRKDKLKRLYKSLTKQTNRNFKWVIIDDGSNDGTKEYVEKFANNTDLKITYHYQENSGKHIAYNNAIQKCNTELFACVDSDDYIEENYVEEIIKTWKANKDNERCIGILTFKKLADKPLTTIKNTTAKFTTLKSAYDKLGLKKDAHLVYKTDSINNFKFPKFENEKFCPEIYLFDKYDTVGYLCILRKALYIVEYMDGGLSDNLYQTIKDNPNGYRQTILNRIKIDDSLFRKFLDSIRYVMYSKISKSKSIVKNSNNKILTVIAYPFGFILSEYLKIKIGHE